MYGSRRFSGNGCTFYYRFLQLKHLVQLAPLVKHLVVHGSSCIVYSCTVEWFSLWHRFYFTVPVFLDVKVPFAWSVSRYLCLAVTSCLLGHCKIVLQYKLNFSTHQGRDTLCQFCSVYEAEHSYIGFMALFFYIHIFQDFAIHEGLIECGSEIKQGHMWVRVFLFSEFILLDTNSVRENKRFSTVLK